MAQALNRWRQPLASSEALDVLHRAMCLASYPCIAMAITSNLPAFFVAIDSLLPTTIAKGMDTSKMYVRQVRLARHVRNHTKSTNHLTNTIVMAVKPLAPPVVWI